MRGSILMGSAMLACMAFSSVPASAANNDGVAACFTGAAVLKTIQHETRDERKTMAVLDLVTQDNFDSFKTILNVSIDVPFRWSAEGGYQAFRDSRATYKHDHSYQSDEALSLTSFKSFVPTEAWPVVLACISRIPVQGPTNLVVRGIPTRKQGFALRVDFPPVPGTPVILRIEGVDGSGPITCPVESLAAVLGTPVPPSGAQILCRRTSDEPGVVIVRTTWGSGSADVDPIAAEVVVPPPPARKALANVVVSGKGDVVISNNRGVSPVPVNDAQSALQVPLHVTSKQASYKVILQFTTSTKGGPSGGANNSSVLRVRTSSGTDLGCDRYKATLVSAPTRAPEDCAYGTMNQADAYDFDDVFIVRGLEPGDYVLVGMQYIGGGKDPVRREFSGFRRLAVEEQ